MIQDSNN